MKGTLKLEKPILINNQEVRELTYDADEITAGLFAEADTRRKIAAGVKNVTIVPAAEFDFSLHPYLGFAAVIAVNPGYDFADLERVRGMDVIRLMEIGRNFILKSEDSAQSSSGEPCGITAEPSKPAWNTSMENE